MKTETEIRTKYICDYCSTEHGNKHEAEKCEAKCKEHLKWAETTSPKFKIGDVVKYTYPGTNEFDTAFIIKAIEKHDIEDTYMYSGTEWYNEELKPETVIEISDDDDFYTYQEPDAFSTFHMEAEKYLTLVYTAQEFEEIRKHVENVMVEQMRELDAEFNLREIEQDLTAHEFKKAKRERKKNK